MAERRSFRIRTETSAFVGAERRVERFVVATLGGYFPVLNRDPDGTLAAVLRTGDIHVGQAGALGIVTSRDQGESWTRPVPVADEGGDMRNPAFGVSSRGTWIVAYIEMTCYENGFWTPGTHSHFTVYVRRSTDKGKTWGEPAAIDSDGMRLYSPFGKIVESEDGTLHMSIYAEKGAFVFRSRDDGLTWADFSRIAEGFGETGLVVLEKGRMLAFLRSSATQEESSLWQSESGDRGYTWSRPERVTGAKQHPADVIRLSSGSLLLSFSQRVAPFGVRAMLSRDEGRSWDRDHTAVLVADCSTWDCGYPSSVQLADGRIFTAYYASDSMGTIKQGERYPIGIHAGGVRYDEGLFKG